MKTGFQIHFPDKLRPQNEDVVVVVRIVRLGGQVNNLFLIPPDIYTLFKRERPAAGVLLLQFIHLLFNICRDIADTVFKNYRLVVSLFHILAQFKAHFVDRLMCLNFNKKPLIHN